MNYSPKWSEYEHFESIHELDSAHVSRVAAPADRLPEEVLVFIFKILIEPRSTSIGPLLLVSHYWHYVAVTTPSIWSRIHSRPHSLEEVRKDTTYFQIAVKNSAGLPLDVTIDLQNLDYWGKKGIPTAVSHEDQRDDADVVLSGLIKAFVGDNRTNIARLRSISLNDAYQNELSFMSSERAIGRLLKELDCPAPLLESLSLHLYSIEPYFFRRRSLHDLKALKHFTFDAGGHLNYIRFIPETIQTLSFRLLGTTQVLSQFIGLRTLSIANWTSLGLSDEADPEVIFPLLECLTLRLCHPSGMRFRTALLPHKIRAPSLNTLRLLDAEAITAVGIAEAYHHVHTLDLLSPQSQVIIGFIKRHLYKYAALVNLTVFPGNLNVVKDEGLALTGLNFVYTIISDKEGMAVDASIELPLWKPASDYIYKKHAIYSGQ